MGGGDGMSPKNSLNVVPLKQLETGTPPSGSRAFDNALRVLRLLHGARLRELQTRINATIVQVQKVTANPRADLSLGRIGR
uniref:Transcriptional regulator n=1 Tax=Globodera pallida TaxID=36090 RepID=A0A183BQK3_GLOPA